MRDTSRYALVIGITVGTAVVEIIGSRATSSNGLLSDALHMLGDGIPFVLGWIILKQWLRKEWAKDVVEISISVFNGFFLLAAGLWLGYRGICRLYHPTEVEPVMLWFALIGVVGNGAQFLFARGLKHAHHHESTYRSQILHLGADWVGSIAVVVAAIVIKETGYNPADSIASLLVAVVTFWAGWKCLVEIYEEPAHPHDNVSGHHH